MKKSTKRNITIKTLKSIRAIACVVAVLLSVFGFILIASEPSPEYDFLKVMLFQIAISVAMWGGAFACACISFKITQLFKECGVE